MTYKISFVFIRKYRKVLPIYYEPNPQKRDCDMSLMNSVFNKVVNVAVGYVAAEVTPIVVKQVKEHGPEVAAAAKEKATNAVETAKVYAPVIKEAIKARFGK